MPRFVVQHHIFSAADEHWDLMLEAGQVLWTWSLPVPPDRGERLPASAKHLGDHRLEYLEYEGEVGRGRVEIHDRGTYKWIGEGPAPELDVADALEFELQGERAKGRYRLRRSPEDGKDLWRFRKLG